MRQKRIWQWLGILLVLALFLAACRDREEDVMPTAMPTTTAPEATATEPAGDATSEEEEVSEPTPAPSPTAVPATAVDPDEIDWPPQLVFSSPAPGERVSLSGAITLRFDQPMDRDSVESALHVTEAESETAVAGSFTWMDDDTVAFTPQPGFKRQQAYKVRVDDTAVSAQGLSLPQPINLELETVGFLEVSQRLPADGADDVATENAITVFFNRPVVPLVSTGDQADLPQPLSLSPAVAGEGEWVSTSIYRFTPAEPLAGAATYQATISGDLEDVAGAVLGEDVTWSFTTAAPRVVDINPENGAQNVNPSRALTVTFNMPMDQASTESAVLVPGVDAPDAEVTPVWSEDGRVLTLKPDAPLQLDTEYQIVVGSGARAANSETTLDGETVSAFTTVPFPAVLSTVPANGAVADRWQSGFTVRFASPMDVETLEGRLTIEPEPTTASYFFNENTFELYVNFSMPRNTEYRVTIPADAADPYGNTLGEAYTWEFRTPDYEPIASFNLPPQIAQLSTSFNTQVDIIHRKVTQMNVSLYEVGLPLSLMADPYNLYEYRPSSGLVQNWDVEPEEEDGLYTLNLAPEAGALPTGVYFLSLNAPGLGEDSRYWQNRRQLLIIGDTNVVVKEMFEAVHVWATDIASGEPAGGRELTLYNMRGVEMGTAVSDENGFASFPAASLNRDYLDGVLVVSNQPGETGFGVGSSNWNMGANLWEMDVQWETGPENPTYAYIYTDRPIYRPGDTVYFKGILRDTDYGRYNLPGEDTITLNLNPAFYQETASLEETLTLDVDPDGAFNGAYTLPEEMSLGTYMLSIPNMGYRANRTFSVAEYRRPEFLVSLTSEKSDVLRGESVAVTLDATYFFGGSAAGLPVNWSARAESHYPDMPGPYYAFGDAANFYADSFGFGPRFGPGSAYLLDGQGMTDENGQLTIQLPADLLEEQEPGSYQVTVEATVQDISNVPVSSRTTLTFHAAETYVGVRPEEYINPAGTETAVSLLTADWDGAPVPEQEVEVVFYRREWQYQRVADFGMYRDMWTPVDTEVERVQVTTDGQGEATAVFTPETGGTYVAVATVHDAAGRSQTSTTSLWVTDLDYISWRSGQRDHSMDLVLDQESYRPGDTAEILVQSPYTESVRAWLTIERGELIEQRLITLETNSDVLELPVTPDYAPNVHVTIVAVKPVTPDSAEPYADVRLGVVEIPVSTEQLALDVSLTPQDDTMAPGETAVYDIRVTDYAGNPVQAELSLALVDLAVLTLKDDNAPPILEAFYPPQPYRSRVGGSLFISGEGLEPEVPQQAGGMGGGGGDGAADEALARAVGEEDEDVRRDFPDTAYWEASVTTDADGTATVEIPLPDTLTTWRLSSKAVTEDTLVGQNSVDIQTSLPLLIRPVTPRFFTVGDVSQIGAIINNNTSSSIEATVSLEAGGLSGELGEQTVTVPANGQEIARWEVRVDDVTAADLTFRVSGGGYEDATKPSFGQGPDNVIPVYRYTGEDLVGTSGVLDEAGRRVEAVLLPQEGLDMRQGGVEANLTPSLAAALLDSLEAVERPPYLNACPHAIADRLLPNAATLGAIRQLDLDEPQLAGQLENLIRSDVAQLESLAQSGGGWGWCYSGRRDPFLTAYVLFALRQAETLDFTVPDAAMADAAAYLSNNLADPDDLDQACQIDRQVFMLFVLNEVGEPVPVLLDRLFEERRSLMNPYAQAMLALTYQRSGFSPDNIPTLVADLSDSVDMSATGAHWETAPETRPFCHNLNGDVRQTAMVLYALGEIDPELPILPSAVRWLMVARRAQVWATPHETAWSILALTQWMDVSGELEAEYSYALLVNQSPALEGQFTADNILSTETAVTPLRQLVPGGVNYFDFQRGEGGGNLYYTLHLDSFIDADTIDPVDRGFSVERAYYDAACDPETESCEPLESIEAGQAVRVELTIVVPDDRVFVVVQDPIPSGAEAVDPGLNISASSAESGVQRTDESYRYGYWGWWYFNRIEFRDEAVYFFSNFLPAGTYQYTYTLQPSIPGRYQVRPATAREEFFPEVFGRSAGMIFSITE